MEIMPMEIKRNLISNNLLMMQKKQKEITQILLNVKLVHLIMIKIKEFVLIVMITILYLMWEEISVSIVGEIAILVRINIFVVVVD